jgi:hypothetical protein
MPSGQPSLQPRGWHKVGGVELRRQARIRMLCAADIKLGRTCMAAAPCPSSMFLDAFATLLQRAMMATPNCVGRTLGRASSMLLSF